MAVGRRSLTYDAAYARLDAPLRAFLRNRAAHEILRRESVSDLAQSVWRELLSSSKLEIRDEPQAMALLLVVGLRKLVQRRRANRRLCRDANRTVLVEAPEQLAEAHMDRDVELEEQLTLLGRALQQIDSRHREVVFLKYFGKLSHHDIADYLRTSPGASRERLSQGMRALRDKFRSLGGDVQAI